MVATRKSLPANHDDDTPTDKLDSRELKRLNIDAKATLKGEKPAPQRQVGGVYHYRGAVYEITADTPQEWIDNNPTRPHQKDGRGRTSTSKSREPEKSVVREEDEIAVPPGKRRRSMRQDVDEEEERPAKRTRRSMPSLPASTSTATRTRTRTSMPAPRSRPRRSTRDTVMEDAGDEEEEKARVLGAADVMAGKDTVKVIAARKREAKKRGLNTSQLPPRNEICGRMIATSVVKLSKINSRIAALRADYERMKGRGAFDVLLDKIRTKKQLGAQLQENDDEDDDEDNDDEAVSAALTTLETKRARQLLAGIDVDALPSSPSHSHSSPDPIALRHSPVIPESPHEATSSSTHRESADPAAIPTPTSQDNSQVQPTPPTSGEDEAEAHLHDSTTISNPGPDTLLNQTSAPPASTTARSSPSTVITTHKPATTSSLNNNNNSKPRYIGPAPHFPTAFGALPALPTVNRGNQPLRWTPRLSEKLHDGERAENAIHMKRLEGESKAQKRRRVKREFREVQRWKVLGGGDGFLGGGGGGEMPKKKKVVAATAGEEKEKEMDVAAAGDESGWTIIRDPIAAAAAAGRRRNGDRRRRMRGDDDGGDEQENEDDDDGLDYEEGEIDDDDEQEGEDDAMNEAERAGERAAMRMVMKHRLGGGGGGGGASGKRRSQPSMF